MIKREHPQLWGATTLAFTAACVLVSCSSVPLLSQAEASSILSKSPDAQRAYKSQERVFASACAFEVTSVRQTGSRSAEATVKAKCGTDGRFLREPHELVAFFEYVGARWFLQRIDLSCLPVDDVGNSAAPRSLASLHKTTHRQRRRRHGIFEAILYSMVLSQWIVIGHATKSNMSIRIYYLRIGMVTAVVFPPVYSKFPSRMGLGSTECSSPYEARFKAADHSGVQSKYSKTVSTV